MTRNIQEGDGYHSMTTIAFFIFKERFKPEIFNACEIFVIAEVIIVVSSASVFPLN